MYLYCNVMIGYDIVMFCMSINTLYHVFGGMVAEEILRVEREERREKRNIYIYKRKKKERRRRRWEKKEIRERERRKSLGDLGRSTNEYCRL